MIKSRKRKPFSELRGRIRAQYGTQAAFAQELGLSATTLSKKLSGKVDWTREEVGTVCGALHIELEDAHLYFFSEGAAKLQRKEDRVGE